MAAYSVGENIAACCGSILASSGFAMVAFRGAARSLGWAAPDVAFQSAPQIIGKTAFVSGVIMGWMAWGWPGLIAMPLIGAVSGFVLLLTTRDFILSMGCLGLPVVFIVGVVALVMGHQ